jgi:hypothetical protein
MFMCIYMYKYIYITRRLLAAEESSKAMMMEKARHEFDIGNVSLMIDNAMLLFTLY